MSQPKGLEITTLQTLDTEYCADATEWCPIDGFQDILLCGTYQLQERKASCAADEKSGDEEVIVDVPRKQVRVGCLYIYQLEKEFLKLQEQLKLDMPGVLDIKWSYQLINGQPAFGLVNSLGQLRVYQFIGNENSSKCNESGKQQDVPSLSLLCECQIGTDCLGLSLEWSNQLRTSEPSVAATDSNGFVSLFKVTPATVEKTCRWKCQDFEAWITAFNQWDPSLLYTGGDDCQLKVWDLRIGTDFPVLVSRRSTANCTDPNLPLHNALSDLGLCGWVGVIRRTNNRDPDLQAHYDMADHSLYCLQFEFTYRYMLAFLSLLVEKRIFQKVKVSFLMVGHTHEDIDQVFSRHTMGVCSIQSNPIQEQIVATGSYDEQVCIWDSRQMRRPVQDIGLGGGIWRIKWEPWSGTKILTATMYNGFHLLQADSTSGAAIDVLSQYTKHESIAYGADWCRLNSNPNVGPCEKKVDSETTFSAIPAKYLISTCSFYDHSLHLWEFSFST